VTRERASVRAALSFAASATAAVAAYAGLRLAQGLLLTEPDPALVVWSEHAGYFWRAWTAVYAGGTAGFVAWLASRDSAARVATILSAAVPAAAAVLAAQATLLP
jgi:hypothetical protein